MYLSESSKVPPVCMYACQYPSKYLTKNGSWLPNREAIICGALRYQIISPCEKKGSKGKRKPTSVRGGGLRGVTHMVTSLVDRPFSKPLSHMTQVPTSALSVSSNRDSRSIVATRSPSLPRINSYTPACPQKTEKPAARRNAIVDVRFDSVCGGGERRGLDRSLAAGPHLEQALRDKASDGDVGRGDVFLILFFTCDRLYYD